MRPRPARSGDCQADRWTALTGYCLVDAHETVCRLLNLLQLWLHEGLGDRPAERFETVEGDREWSGLARSDLAQRNAAEDKGGAWTAATPVAATPAGDSAECAPVTLPDMCNLYQMTRNRDTIRQFFRVDVDRTASQPPLLAIFPDHLALAVRIGGDVALTMDMMRCGFPPPPNLGTPLVTNVRNTAGLYWRGWLKRSSLLSSGPDISRATEGRQRAGP